YVGLVALMLAIVAVLCKSDVRTRFWGLAAALCFLLAMGGYAPLQFYRVMYYVPVVNLFRVPARHLMEGDFGLGVLAGRGFTVLSSAKPNQRPLFRTVLVGATVFLLTFLAVTWLRPADFRLGRDAAVGVIRAPELFVPIALAALSAFALWWLAKQK